MTSATHDPSHPRPPTAPPQNLFAGPGIMLISAAIFGYFGFFTIWLTTSGTTGEFLFFVALLEWTLKVSSVGFALSAIVTLANPFVGNLLYSIVGVLGAIALVIVGILDIADAQHTAMHPAILFLFAAWNGYNSWTGLRALLAYRAMTQPQTLDTRFQPPDASPFRDR